MSSLHDEGVARQIRFRDFEWSIKSASDEKVGPGPNYFSDEMRDIFADGAGLHLRTGLRGGKWLSTEAVLSEPLGYGTYQFKVAGNLRGLGENTVFGAFIYEDDGHELDIEFSPALAGFGRGQYVAQPASLRPWRIYRFAAPSVAETSHRIVWSDESVHFASWTGTGAKPSSSTLIAEWRFSGSRIPSPDNGRFIFNLWLHEGKGSGREEEIMITSFSFLPPRTR